MKFQFFDIGAFNHKGTALTSSIGIVRTNSDFQITDKQDLLIKPELAQRLRDTSSKEQKKKLLQLVADPAVFLRNFPRVVEVLEDPTYINFAFSTPSDYNFLKYSTKWHRLPRVELTSFDVQKIYKSEMPWHAKYGISLRDACNAMAVEKVCNDWSKSVKDAELTMRLFEAITNFHRVEPIELLARNIDGVDHSLDF
ncbi:MAG: hypothetical protein FWE31_01300 [Firmicutes bacterium]|nr:hypothetical protein [Bacillota bacterium]